MRQSEFFVFFWSFSNFLGVFLMKSEACKFEKLFNYSKWILGRDLGLFASNWVENKRFFIFCKFPFAEQRHLLRETVAKCTGQTF